MPLKRLRKTRPPIRNTPLLRQSALDRRDVTRAEFNHIVDLLNERGEIVDRHTKELEIQLKRMAQMQSELDEMRSAWQRLKRMPFPGSDGQG